jgi:hypothetical protein
MEEQTLDIPMTTVQSSQIHAIGYDAPTSTLRVQFKNKSGPSAPYDYAGVPPETAEAFQKAESVGRFFGAEIKGKFDYRKLPPPEPAALDVGSDKPLAGGSACTGETCQ